MTPQQAAHDIAAVVLAAPAGFMTAPETFARGTELGFDGMDFYVAGRGGVLGDVPADVATASFWVFAADTVRPMWDRAGAVMSRRDAAVAWSAVGHDWARNHWRQGPDFARAAMLLGRVVHDAPVAGTPIFAGARLLPEPEDAVALAQHRLNLLRELRGALHGAALLTVGLSPLEAVVVRAPDNAELFGWTPPFPEPEPFRERWALAEARTDRMVGRHMAVLDGETLDELVGIVHEIGESVA
ncbi:MAG: SCO6745 family protein [Acidimicrobiia bacterium]